MAPAKNGSTRLTNAGLLSAIMVGLVGAIVILITPGFLAVIAQKTGFDNDQLGYLAAWDINAMGVTVGLSTFALSRVSWRLAVGVGLALMIAGNLLTAGVDSFPAMAAARVIAGAGEGIAVGFSFAALGRATNPDRAFAIYLVVGAVLSAAFLYALPLIQASVAPAAVFLGIAGMAALVLLLLGAFPEGGENEPDAFAGAATLDMRYVSGALIGVFLLFFAMGAVWSYSQQIGLASGLSPQAIAGYLSAGRMAGIFGAGLAGALPRRSGRALPLIISGIVGVVAFLMMRGQVAPFIFLIATVMMMFSWNFAMPLMSGICAEACSRGRIVCAMGAIQTFGTGLGPAVAAATLATGSFSTMIYMAAAALILSVIVTVTAITRHARRIQPSQY
jgi:predicted MFS family arabinose efflux permease